MTTVSSGFVYTVSGAASSDKGDYRASSLNESGSWDVSTGSGAFTYSLPIQVPAPPMGGAPSLALTYNSQSVDGRTSASNNQASWVGMGWDLNVGYIERRYVDCADNGLPTIGDMCWDSPNTAQEPSGAVYVINLNGVNSQLVQDNTGTGSYHLQGDPGWRVQHLTGGHGADDEYWVISTQDGKRYYFGWGRSERTGTATASVFTVPVVGNDTGEPCHSQFPEPCTQAWRWNLDRTVDANEIESMYFYDKEYNYYRSVADVDKARQYVSGGYLKEIQYGWSSQMTDGQLPAKVELTHVNRCVERMTDNDPLRSEPKACPTFDAKPESYPDVPVDLMCDGTSADYECAGKTYYPTFFNTDMLWDIKTYVRDNDSADWNLVMQYQTKHGLPNPDGSIGKTLWLDYMQRKSYGTGTDTVLPVINFNGVDLDNKVGSTELNFRRVNEIHGDLGSTTTVTYGQPNACDAANLPTQASNTQDCYWQKWTPDGTTTSKTGWFKKFLVTKVTVDPTVGSDQDGEPVMTTSYTYEDGAGWRFAADPLTADEDESWSDWRGYQEVQVTSGSGDVQHTTKYWLYRGLSGDRTAKDTSATKTVTVNDGDGHDYTDHAWLSGQVLSTSLRDEDGTSHERTYHSYWDHNTAQYDGLPDARIVRESQTTTKTLISGSAWREHIVQNEYDASTATSATFGLPLREDDWGESDISDNRCTTYGRAFNTDNYDGSDIQRWTVLTDQTKHYTVGCSSIADGNQDGYASTLYDDAASIDANKPTDGNPTEVRTYTTSGTYRTVKTHYDNAGRATWTKDGNDQKTTTVYAPANSWPVDGVTVTTPDPDDDASLRGPLSTTTWYSRFWGTPYKSTDANGNITRVELDAAGRTSEVWLPTETGDYPSMKFSYSVPDATNGSGVPDAVNGTPQVTSSTLQSGNTYLSSHLYTDALGRTRETQTKLPQVNGASQRQVAVTRYDSAGNVTGSAAPFLNDGAAGSDDLVNPAVSDLPSYNDLTLDWTGRTTESRILVNGTAQTQGDTKTVYHGDYTTLTPPTGGALDTYTDVYGQTGKVVEHSGSSTYTTSYTYTAKDELKTISDPRGNITTYGYDWAGQRTSTSDPDAGASSTTYDANGKVEKTTSNAGTTVLNYAYDNLGRQISVYSGSDELAAWHYDGAVANGKGQLTSSTSHDTSGNTYTTKATGFDARGRALGSTVTIPSAVTGLAGDYTTTYGYDAADHVTQVTYPTTGDLTAETVTTAYDSYGQPTTLTSSLNGGTTYVGDTTYDDYGRLKNRTYGQLLGGVNSSRSYSYDDVHGTRALTGISTNISVPGTISQSQNDAYSRDDSGEITALKESIGGQQQCFSYDNFHRLTQAWTASSLVACSTGTPNPDFSKDGAYQSAYTYDRLGNLQSVTDTNSSGTPTTRDYIYPGYTDDGTWTTANTEDPPHGVTKIQHQTASGTVTSTDTYTYDDAGQMLHRSEPATSTTTASTTDYTWTKTGRLATVTTTKSTGSDLTRYAYDAGGTLLVRTSPSETIAYLTGQDIRTTNGTTKTATRYYTCGGTTVAMRTANGVTWLMADQQASTQLTVNASTGALTRRRYTPFGDQRGNQTLPAATDRGFLGKTEDTTTGLSLLGARAYDPLLGRFLSPDPLTTPYDPQNLSAYSYSVNNPINYSDPTGLEYGSKPNSCQYDISFCTPEEVGDLPGGSAGGAGGILGGGSNTAANEYKCGYVGCTDDEVSGYGKHVDELMKTIDNVPKFPDQVLNFASDYLGITDAKDCKNGDAGACLRVSLEIAQLLATRGKSMKLAGCKSFDPSTRVLMANGKTKPIGKIKTGDKVEAGDQKTGKHRSTRTVSATHINHDDDLVDLIVRAQNGHVAVVHTTSEHPFRDETLKAWVGAGHLATGHRLATTGSAHVSVVATKAKPGAADMYNLTVDELHTYYVLAGQTPVLVHNSNCDVISGSLQGEKLAQKLRLESANSPFTESGQLTPDAISGSRLAMPGTKMGNKELQARFAERGGASQWGKYSTETHQSPYGDYQVHYYMNRVSGEVMYDYDYKVVMNRRGSAP